MHELILHHYDLSPYAEKVRSMFGFENLAWRSVQIRVVMPKPDLTELTSGYRRTSERCGEVVVHFPREDDLVVRAG